jgi:predicted acyltransferase
MAKPPRAGYAPPMPPESECGESDMTKASERLLVLDVLRGLAVAGMILVTSPGDWNSSYWFLRHAEWNGWTLADMVFPAFLFAVGMAVGLSFPRQLSAPGARTQLWARVARRTIALIVLGLIVNWTYTADILGIPVGLGRPGLAFMRIPGVLQRIALCYLATVALILAFPRRLPGGRVDINPRALVIAIAAALIGYWLLLRFVPVPGYGAGRLDQAGNLTSYIDRAIFTPPHMWVLGWPYWDGPIEFDPEGLLSTITAATNSLFGVLAAWAWRRSPEWATPRLAIAGAVLMGAGLLLNPIFPINKLIWTSSFALLSAGFSALTLAALSVALRSRLVERLAAPLRVLGRNAVLAFLLSIVLSKFSAGPWFHLDGATLSGQAWGFAIARKIIPDPSLAATACAFGILAIIILMVWPLHRRGIHFRL